MVTKTDFIRIIAPKNAIGFPAGQRLLTEVAEAVQRAPETEGGVIVMIDLKHVTLATTSYVKAGLLAPYLAGQRFADASSSQLRHTFDLPTFNVYPVFANLQEEVQDTMQEVFAGRGLPFLSAAVSGEAIESGRLFGFLDDALVKTLRLIKGRCAVTALDLAAEFTSEGIKATAWNNRLNDLWRLRLLRRTKRGKAWWYEPVVKEITYGR